MIINGVTLKNPDWGNEQRSNTQEPIIHHARDGSTIQVYKRTSTLETIHFTLGYNAYEDLKDLFDTLKTAMHQEIDITDWDDNVWTDVRLLTNPFEMTAKYRKCDTLYQTEGYEITLEFEGVPA